MKTSSTVEKATLALIFARKIDVYVKKIVFANLPTRTNEGKKLSHNNYMINDSQVVIFVLAVELILP